MVRRTLDFTSHTANLALVRGFVREFLSGLPFTDSTSRLLVLGLDEACSNVIRHAYKDQQDQPITLICETSETGICFRLRDFAPEACVVPATGRCLDEVRPGGLGIHLIRSTFDKVNYRRRSKGTELVLEKQFCGQTDSTRPTGS